MQENKKLNNAGNTATPYDDVYRTLLNDCTSLIIPVVNEVFKKRYQENEKVTVLNNEFYITMKDGKQRERITDSNFVIGNTCYHFECQSTPDHMDICIRVPEASCTYRVPVLKVQNYPLEEIFEKRLFFLIPFHIFSYEKNFSEYESDEEKLQELQQIYIQIVRRLNHCVESGMISEYIKATVVIMSKKVLDALTAKYSRVQEGVGKIMGGKILDYEAKDILNRGRAEGHAEGLAEGRIEAIRVMVKTAQKYNVSDEEIIEQLVEELSIDEEEATEYLRKALQEATGIKK